LALAE